ncbi:hypothetical protein NQZ68_040330 [Dissostichus eleginoides]|nr:hypothetical protein NQZ68_040330 [Dissostichus eleginoides]
MFLSLINSINNVEHLLSAEQEVDPVTTPRHRQRVANQTQILWELESVLTETNRTPENQRQPGLQVLQKPDRERCIRESGEQLKMVDLRKRRYVDTKPLECN